MLVVVVILVAVYSSLFSLKTVLVHAVHFSVQMKTVNSYN